MIQSRGMSGAHATKGVMRRYDRFDVAAHLGVVLVLVLCGGAIIWAVTL